MTTILAAGPLRHRQSAMGTRDAGRSNLSLHHPSSDQFDGGTSRWAIYRGTN